MENVDEIDSRLVKFTLYGETILHQNNKTEWISPTFYAKVLHALIPKV
jgi:hypothetical protein